MEKLKRNKECAKNKKKNRQKGITLIALVITIIVLLILAAVSIATLTGENGILSKANTVKEETQREDAKEQAKLDIAAYVTDELAKGGDGSITNEIIKGILTGKDYVKDGNPGDESFESTTGQEIPYSELYGKIGDTGGTEGSLPSTENTKPYLPSSEFSQKEGDLSTGLVIQDKAGNSYVWIEVPKTETVYATAKLDITDFSTENLKKIETDLQNYVGESYRKTNYEDKWYEGCGLKDETEYTELKNKMIKSVYENGGFWIGQYEMGTETLRTSKDAELTDPVCKEGAYPYNFVTCKQAQEKASSMKSGDYESSLMFGIQWDLVMKYIAIKGEKVPDGDCTSWGNYSNATFTVTKGKYSTDSGKTFKDVTEETEQKYTKLENKSVLLTTGAEVEESGNKRKK